MQGDVDPQAAHDEARRQGGEPLFDRLSRQQILTLLDELAPAFAAEGAPLASIGAENAGWRAAVDFYSTIRHE